MQAIIKQLDKLCTDYKWEEKVLLVDSHSIGKQLIRAFNEEGFQAINLKTKTVLDIAKEILDIHDEKLDYLTPAVGAHFMYDVLKKLRDSDRLTYFQAMEVTPSFSNRVYQTITELRLNGYTSQTLNKQAFISSQKAADLAEIMTAYETMVLNNHLMDDAAIFQQAIKYAKPQHETTYVLQSYLSLTQLEHQLLQRVLPDDVMKLPLPNIYGIHIPSYEDFRSIAWGEPTAFSYIYELADMQEKPDLCLHTAKTEEVELKQIMEQIKQSAAPLDQCAIYYTKTEPYVTLAYQFTEKYQLPITFGDGLPISFSRPGKLVKAFMKWMKDRYSVPAFIELIHEGLLELPDGSPSAGKIVRILRDAKVGWDPSRYVSQLSVMIEQYSQKLAEARTDSQQEFYKQRLRDVTWLQEWFAKLFKQALVIADEVNYQKLLQGIAFILKHHSKTTAAIDETARTEMLEKIDLLLPFAEASMPAYDAFEKVNDLLLSMRVNRSGPKPGHLHVGSYKQGLYHHRSQVFIVGLDNRSFPGTPSEDPLLLDEERSELSQYIPLLQEAGKENLYRMLQLLTLTNGHVSFSYCSFDMNDNRSVSPSHLFLQGYRMTNDEPEADFNAIKAMHARLTAKDVLDDKDYWHNQLALDQGVSMEPKLIQQFENLPYGIEAVHARQLDEFTAYDGKVVVDPAIYDPRKNKQSTMTAGKLEKLASCPYAYFLEEILEIKPVEELTFDPYTWLDAATRGSLLHRVFETFYKQLKSTGEKPVYASHVDRILDIAQQQIDEQKQLQPPPSERVYEREVEDIRQRCHIFLKEEEAHSEQFDAREFEYTFGVGSIDPATVLLPSKQTIHVSGKIDRVDQSNDGHFHIIDYKTGGTYSYSENEPFKGGRQLQHFIYAVAIEQHLKLEVGSVKESSYYFPSTKGLGDRYVRSQHAAMRANGHDLLEKLIDVIKHGHFTMTDDVHDCTFCDFKSVCRREFYPKQTLEAKQMDEKAEGLRKFKGVRAYE